jgi:two-component system LytT family sensor kinase
MRSLGVFRRAGATSDPLTERMKSIKRLAHRLRWPVSAERLSQPLLRERRTWFLITLFWVLAGLTSWLLEYGLSFGRPEGPMTLGRAASRLVYAVLWWCVTVFAVWISDKVLIRNLRQYLRLAFHIVVGVAVAIAWAVVTYNINLAIIPGWVPLGVGRMINTTFITSYFYYVGMVALVHGIVFARESHAREIDALQKARLSIQAQLQVLKMELQPHFLFNTLHSISALMHRDVNAANEMLVLLADMLEVALQNVRDQEVTLEDELQTLRLYIEIQQIRFGDRLQADYDIDPVALSVRVPHMIFQPLVENAIKHGIADRATGGRVEISAHVLDDHVELVVQDDGLGLKDTRPSHGIGLTNTRDRLAFLYGDRHRFELRDAVGGGVRVEVSIPLRRGEALTPGS